MIKSKTSENGWSKRGVSYIPMSEYPPTLEEY